MEIRNFFEGKKILITGSTGTIGREIVYQLLKLKPASIRLFSRDESRQFDMQHELRNFLKDNFSIDHIRDGNIRYLIGDIREEKRLRQALKDIDIVFHTAALKHVLACEYNPFEALKTNTIGTQNLIEAALDEGVEYVVYTSSDKAVNPTNAMGTSKLFAEKLVTAANYYKGKAKTKFLTVRFGNVIGSTGSAILTFLKQIKNGGPVTLTDSRMTRFIMTIGEAVNLIFKATTLANGGEIFILKMPAVKIEDLINIMIEEVAPKFGYDCRQILIEKIGAQPGEKLYEELMTSEEAERAFQTEDMFIVMPQLPELVGSFPEYPNAEKVKAAIYNSLAQSHLTNEEIKEFLFKTGITDSEKERALL